MVSTFSRFNVTITDVDPGPTVDHFEVMVAGSPEQIGLGNGIGGIAEFSCQAPGACQKYMPNALVFAFAGVYGNMPHEICATAAQEIAHTFSLDHVQDPSDPMTYNTYSGMRQFKDGVTCGSDCFGSPLKNRSASRAAAANERHQHVHEQRHATQNDVQVMLALFGPAGANAPTLTLKNPTNNSTQPPAFSIDVDCTSTEPVQEVNLSIDGQC